MEPLLRILLDLEEMFRSSNYPRPAVVANLSSQPLPGLPDTPQEAVAGKKQLPLDVWVSLHSLGQAAGLTVVKVTLPDPEYGWGLQGYLAKHGDSYGFDALAAAFKLPTSLTAQLLAGEGEAWPCLGDIETARRCLTEAPSVLP
jgi:hypothetical protein